MPQACYFSQTLPEGSQPSRPMKDEVASLVSAAVKKVVQESFSGELIRMVDGQLKIVQRRPSDVSGLRATLESLWGQQTENLAQLRVHVTHTGKDLSPAWRERLRESMRRLDAICGKMSDLGIQKECVWVLERIGRELDYLLADQELVTARTLSYWTKRVKKEFVGVKLRIRTKEPEAIIEDGEK